MGTPNFKPTEQHILCSDHFTEDCLQKHPSRPLELKRSSIPTIFPPETRSGGNK